MEENKEFKKVKENVGDLVIARIDELSKANFHLPKDYDAVSAIKMSMLKLAELKDKNGKPALEVCTSSSVQSALFKMCCLGLNIAYNQAYPVVRGNVLCIDPGYFGHVLMVKRIFPDWEPNPQVIRQDDEFTYETDVKTGRKKLVSHVQKLENIDKDFIGGYIILPTNDGEGSLYIMTKKQILTAWSKSSTTSLSVHKQFDEKMIGKTLVNSGCNMIINSTPSYNVSEDEDIAQENTDKAKLLEPEYSDFEEVKEDNNTPDEVPTKKKNKEVVKEVEASNLNEKDSKTEEVDF